MVAVDNRLVHLRASVDVVRLDGEHFLQGVRGAISLQRPHFHFAEALTAELRLAAQRLLGDQAVRPVERACILSSTRWFNFSMYM